MHIVRVFCAALVVSLVSLPSAWGQGCGCGCGGEGQVCGCGSACCGVGAGDEGPNPEVANAAWNMRMLSNLSFTQMGGNSSTRGNDIWGWTDPQTQREYAIVGRTDGTSFVDVTNPTSPVNLGFLPRTAGNSPSTWRDIKVYNDHAFIVADDASTHGMQVFDLTRLRTATGHTTYTADARYAGFGSSHNLAINIDTGYAYAVGTSQNGLHMVDIRDPKNPVFAGFAATPSYTHDSQVVIYRGPDAQHVGREVAFSSTANTFTISDLTDKSSPSIIKRVGYTQNQYAHQGWLTEDQRYFLMNDELDENTYGGPTRTHIWDVADLENPVYKGYYRGQTNSIDHNLYIRGDYAYLSNYTSGLRVIDISNPDDPNNIHEVGFFDTYMQSNSVSFNGAWSSYVYFPSGNIITNDISNGLYVISTVQVPGDANWDGHVSGADYTIWADNFEAFNGDALRSNGDFNDDGFVTGADYTVWADMFGRGPLDGPTNYSGIPEPASLTLLAAGSLALLLIRRRH